MSLSRRDFVKGTLAASIAATGALAGRRARARIPVNPVAVLLLDFAGGWNIHASFAARTHPQVNPHGLYTGADTGKLRLSNLLFGDRDAIVKRDAPGWKARMPGFEEVAPRFSLIGAMRHAQSYDLDDHPPSALLCGTGYLDRLDVPGIATVIGRYAPRDREAPPSVIIGKGYASAEMARAPGPWLPSAPVMLTAGALPTGGTNGAGWPATEDRLDAASRRPRRALAAQRVDAVRRYKDAFRRHRRFFVDPAVQTADPAAGGARYDKGVLGAESPSNQQLIEAFGGTLDGDEAAMALAFRCLEGGSRFVAVGLGFHFRINAHDTHENEAESGPLYVRDAQLLAGLTFLLDKVGLADKVLVVGVSEMARCPYPEGGYNAAGGTDHGHLGLVSPKRLYGSTRQSVLLAHGPIQAGREAYPADPEYGDPAGAPCITAELLAFLAEAAGVAREDHPWSVSPDGVPLDADTLARELVL